jgi:hypothetical protein
MYADCAATGKYRHADQHILLLIEEERYTTASP